MKGGVVILDFGSQVTQLIARRLRELNVYSQILPFNTSLAHLGAIEPEAIILSGGPMSVNEKNAPLREVQELIKLAPVMGICYGMQLIAKQLGGVVNKAQVQEYGRQKINWSKSITGTPETHQVWMSHGDVVMVPPPGVKVIAKSNDGHPAAMEGDNFFCVQFHPEVTHTDYGIEILKHFLFNVAEVNANWDAPNIVELLVKDIKQKVGKNETVLCALSGGVDSTVAAALCTKALGNKNVICVFVDNGLLRKNEYEDVLARYKKMGLTVVGVNAEKAFLQKLKGISEPEKKRKTIGHVFIDVFEHSIKKLDKPIHWLCQGTLYPDVIESITTRGESVTIKSHHNVGGLPDKMKLKLVEPLRELFKDEVRLIGKELKVPDDILRRHPFPGPGLAIRVIGKVGKKDLDTLRECDDIFIQELKSANLYDKIWQAFCVLMPIQTVGVQGDARTYEKVLALRAVTSTDGMTADWFEFDSSFLKKVSNRITNEVRGVNRVVYDITSKPPGTIEWE